MTRDQLRELHYIAPISNLRSILQRGLLSHALASRVKHDTVAKPGVQERRSKVIVPNGLPLHRYVNLYFCARNPMLFARREQHESLAMLRVDTAVLDISSVVVSDQNAASTYVRFGKSPAGLQMVDFNRVFAEYWTNPDDPIAEWRHKSVKWHEVLVPKQVESRFILGAYVSGPTGQEAIEQLAIALPITIDPVLFFLSRSEA